jgi:hypothetical protein
VDVSEVLLDGFGRLPDLVRSAVDGLSPDQLGWAPAPGANTIGWLVWHLTRIQDHHVSHLLDADQLWVTGDWAPRFELTAEPQNTGYGHGPDEVAGVRSEGFQILIDYYTAVAARTDDLLRSVKPDDLDRVVDRRWNPPVTLGVRLVSILGDDLEHVGQANYVRGLLVKYH